MPSRCKYDDASFDLVVCRHMSQAVPDFPLVLAEITRVLKPGGWLHLLSEDYGMLHMPVIERDGVRFDPDRFWNANAVAYLQRHRLRRPHRPAFAGAAGAVRVRGHRAGLHHRRHAARASAKPSPASCAPGAMATRRCWRKPPGARWKKCEADFDTIIASIETPPYYAVWHVPVVSGPQAARG